MSLHLAPSRCRLPFFAVVRGSINAPIRRGYAGSRLLQSRVPIKYPASIFKVSEEVAEAVHSGTPVVALETTIYTHGFPYPDNVSLATHLESVVRINGAIPATIGIINGVARVGLSQAELVELASAAGKPETMKVSRRDLPFITGLGMAGKNLHGGTTIAGTMILAQMAGIEIFGTGGLGGVHRGGQDTMDISADLTELGRTPVTVISSGPKAFLDLPRTLEYLETQGVMVGTFADGRTGTIEIPAFYTRDSGIKSPFVVENEKEAAAIIYARRLLNVKSGLLLANPIPEEFSIPKAEITSAIEEAIANAELQGVHGHANTPFILARIKELTKGSSIPANRALIESNVARSARVAVELAQLGAVVDDTFMPAYIHPPEVTSAAFKVSLPSPTTNIASGPVSILVAGSIAIDLSCDYTPTHQTQSPSPALHTSNPATISQSIGGVGHNVFIAASLASPPHSVRLCSLIASDLAGQTILNSLSSRGLDVSGIQTLPSTPDSNGETERTAQYVAVNDTNKDLALGMSDMSIISTPRSFNATWLPTLTASRPSWLILDANWNAKDLGSWIRHSRSLNSDSKIAYEPVSVAKAGRIFPPQNQDSIPSRNPEDLVLPSPLLNLTTPNIHELTALHTAAKQNGYLELPEWWSAIDAFGIPSSGARDKFQVLLGRALTDAGVPQMMVQLLPFCPMIVTKLGSEGIVVAKVLEPNDPRLTDRREAPYILSRNLDDHESIGGIYMRKFGPAEVLDEGSIVSVNGVGDAFLGVLVAGLARGLRLDEELLDVAQRAAVLTLGSRESVAPAVEKLRTEIDELVRGISR